MASVFVAVCATVMLPSMVQGSEEKPVATVRSELFHGAGFLYGIDGKLLEAIAEVESSLNPRAVSHKGAQGLMQLMPAMSKQFGVNNPFDPVDSAMGAARFLAYLKRTLVQSGRSFEDELAALIACYHAGEGAVFRHNGVPPYADTREYVRRVKALYNAKMSQVASGGSGRPTSAAWKKWWHQ